MSGSDRNSARHSLMTNWAAFKGLVEINTEVTLIFQFLLGYEIARLSPTYHYLSNCSPEKPKAAQANQQFPKTLAEVLQPQPLWNI